MLTKQHFLATYESYLWFKQVQICFQIADNSWFSVLQLEQVH